MTVTVQRMTLDEYLAFDDGTDTQYELVNGELVVVPPESELNRRIASFLFAYFLQQGVSSDRLSMKTEIVVSGAGATTRVPDLMLMSEELVAALEGARRSTIMPEMPPLLVVEVVSPGQENRDYRYKRPLRYLQSSAEYAARGIAEYWIIDPIQQQVTVLEWVEGWYEEKNYTGESSITPKGELLRIASPLLGNLTLTAAQVLQGRA